MSVAEGFVLFAATGTDRAEFEELRPFQTEIGVIAEAGTEPERPCLLLLDDSLAAAASAAEQLTALPGHLALLVRGEAALRLAEASERFFLVLEESTGRSGALRSARAAVLHSTAELSAARSASQLAQASANLEKLNRIGMALMSEREQEVLLELILSEARHLTGSDAASLYLVEENGEQEKRLRFRLTQNHSLPEISLPEFELEINRSSLAGYVAATGEVIVLEDVYQIPETEPYSFNREFDREFGYRAKSMLVVPMLDTRGGTVGVLQLVNCKRDPEAVIRDEASAEANVIPFTDSHMELALSLSGQAAVSVENSRLHQAIEALFEGFIKAAVIAIDQRDPTTSGHSVRVAELTCEIASLVDRDNAGRFQFVGFTRPQMRELRYASLLHDFGKVGVREEVLVKAKKLPPVLHEQLIARFKLIRSLAEGRFQEKQANYLRETGSSGFPSFYSKLAAEHEQELSQLERFFLAIEEANMPRVLPEEAADVLQEIARFRFVGIDGETEPYLTNEEVQFLSIARGSLDTQERREIESHVSQTYRFLEQIPWTENLSRVAEIAYGHHEKLDGSGYPKGIGEKDIPLQTRIMTVSDIFDALTASDRPYKVALPWQRALDILKEEADQQKLDTDVLDLMIGSQAYRRILEEDWRKL